jgi:general secretion pathway protein D
MRDTLAGMYRVRSPAVRLPVSVQRPPGAPQRSDGGIELFVIHLRHARAADVAAGVNALYGRASAMGELGTEGRSRPSTLDDAMRQSSVPPIGADGRPAADMRALASRSTSGFGGEVNIVPDSRTNSLLVRSSRTDFDLISAAVRELDVRPLQVLIEVVIVEVRRDRALAFGLETVTKPAKLPGSSGGTLGGNVSGGGSGDMVLRLLDFSIGSTQLNATLSAAASSGDVQIVSRPVVIAANNELAEIVVGSQRPFIQVQRSLPTEAASRDQVVQYRDVGTRLSVRPTISADGYVMLAVTQEINAATTETAFDAPVISTRSVQTQLLIKDKSTVVLGGLIDRQRDNNSRGVPVLSRIPILGGLFGRVDRRSTETELFMFLTPRVIARDEDAESVTLPLRQRANPPERPL